MSDKSSNQKMPRREFLANLLFAGTAISVVGLQTEYDLVARKDPKDEGWKLPEDWKESQETEGWELPDDLMQNPNPPRPPEPRPQPQGGRRPPHIRGKVKPPPPLEGDVRAPSDD